MLLLNHTTRIPTATTNKSDISVKTVKKILCKDSLAWILDEVDREGGPVVLGVEAGRVASGVDEEEDRPGAEGTEEEGTVEGRAGGTGVSELLAGGNFEGGGKV